MRRLLLACLAPVAATVASCLGPTQIMLHVTTNACTALTRVDVYVGGASAPATSAVGCVDSTSGEIGYIGVVPSGAIDDHVDLGVVGAVGDSCASLDTKEAKCIVAKRSISFVPHTRLDVPIFLDTSCAGLCNDPGTTCIADPTPHCVSTTCGGDGGIACVVDAGGPSEASIIDVGLPETTPPPTCANVGVDGGAPILSWSFDPHSDLLIHEDQDTVAAQAPGSGNLVTTSPPTFCGSYLGATSAQLLAPSDKRLGSLTFTLGFAYRTTTTNSELLRLNSASQFGGYTIILNTGLLSVYFTTNVSSQVYQDTAKTADGQWHRFVMHVLTTLGDAGQSSTVASFSRDGATPTEKSVTYIAAQGPFVAGPVEAIDQVEMFAF